MDVWLSRCADVTLCGRVNVRLGCFEIEGGCCGAVVCVNVVSGVVSMDLWMVRVDVLMCGCMGRCGV